MQHYLVTACLAAMLTATVFPAHGEDGKDIEWKRVSDAGVMIEYQAEMEETARELLPELVKRLRDVPAVGSSEHLAELDELAKNKEKILGFMAQNLGMEKPGSLMDRTFDQAIQTFKQVLPSIPDAHLVKLWQKETLVSLLTSGEDAPGWKWNAESKEPIFNLNIQVQPGGSNKPKELVQVHASKDTSTAEAVKSIADQVTQFAMGMDQFLYPATYIFHDIAANGFGEDIGLRSAFGRWFLEGVACSISDATAKEFPGKLISPIPSKWDSTAPFEKLKGRVDLLSWRSPGWMPDIVKGELLIAHQAFAVSEIRGLISRHGEKAIPSIIKEYTKSEAHNNQAILDAIKKVTDEDFVQVLNEYGKESTDIFKGLAVRSVAPCTIEIDPSDGEAKVRDSGTIPIAKDGKPQFGFHFAYESLMTPIAAKLELIKIEGEDVVASTDLNLTKPTDAVLATFDTSKLEPGDYKVRMYFSDKPMGEIRFKLVAAE